LKKDFDTEYKDFLKERRRWKGDFDVAIFKATG